MGYLYIWKMVRNKRLGGILTKGMKMAILGVILMLGLISIELTGSKPVIWLQFLLPYIVSCIMIIGGIIWNAKDEK